MSTTLKALQRLEQCQPRPGDDDMASERPGLKSRPGKASSGQWGRLAKIAFITLLAWAVAVAVVYVIVANPSTEYRAAVSMPIEPPGPGSRPVFEPAPISPSIPKDRQPATQTAVESASLPSGFDVPFEAAISPWRGDGIKVQAIVCVPNPDASMAVVNNRTVRRGDQVEGYVVRAILEKAVVIARGGEKWKVVLGR